MLRLVLNAGLMATGLVLVAQTASTMEPLAVEIITAEPVEMRVEHSLTGEIRASDSVVASFPIAGRVVEILVEEGQKVTLGALLARLDPVQQEQALRSAEAGLATARADSQQANADFTRADALLQQGATTRAARDAAEDALQIKAGVLAQARADLDRARKALNDTELKAPQDATVTDRMAEAGQVVGAAQPVLELALSNGMEAAFEVPEVLLTGQIPEKTVRMSRLSDPAQEFIGTVSEVSPLVDPVTGTVAVTLTIADPPPGLSYGEAVRGTAMMAGEKRIVLPYAVLSATAAGPAVWKVDPATKSVALTPVTVESYQSGSIVLSGGIGKGDFVVGHGAQLLYPGRVVRAAGEAE
ncbi:MAG: efflux RND transporter periplasmic adaptor subunit [Proteobacteria bacterium]|nr:efflux RND transporter periplasmic adaptor subunit [Pseudomonadota bacterium]